MNEQFENEQFSQFLNKQLQQEAEQIEKELIEHPELTDLSPDDGVKEKLYEQIREYEKQKVLSRLSAEDQEALQLGRMLQKEREEEKRQRFARKHRMGWKRAVAVAAVMVFVLGLSITSVGGPERVLEVMQQVVGGREMTRINSDNDEILSSGENEEEKAYQQIKDELGIDPVRIAKKPEKMKFIQVEIDEQLQMAHLYYENEEKMISYTISGMYTDNSVGLDMEDTLIDEYIYSLEECEVQIYIYEVMGSGETTCKAEFEYRDIQYFLIGIIKEEDLKEILDNLYFL